MQCGFEFAAVEGGDEVAVAAQTVEDGAFDGVGVVGAMQDDRGMAGEVADGAEQFAQVFLRIEVDDCGAGVAFVAEAVEPVGGSGRT